MLLRLKPRAVAGMAAVGDTIAPAVCLCCCSKQGAGGKHLRCPVYFVNWTGGEGGTQRRRCYADAAKPHSTYQDCPKQLLPRCPYSATVI